MRCLQLCVLVLAVALVTVGCGKKGTTPAGDDASKKAPSSPDETGDSTKNSATPGKNTDTSVSPNDAGHGLSDLNLSPAEGPILNVPPVERMADANAGKRTDPAGKSSSNSSTVRSLFRALGKGFSETVRDVESPK